MPRGDACCAIFQFIPRIMRGNIALAGKTDAPKKRSGIFPDAIVRDAPRLL
jgi:hypothetical protein